MSTIIKRMRCFNLLLYCCACVCVKHCTSVQQLHMNVNDVVIKHAQVTMSLFDDQLDAQHIQINQHTAQLQTNQSVQISFGFDMNCQTLSF